MSGFIHLYTGNGKGKTTAAFGLALRSAGAGRRVFIAQFVKGMHYSELDVIKRIPEIELKQYGLDCFIVNEPTQKDIDAAQQGLTEVTEYILEQKADMVILDEICIALHYQLIAEEEEEVLKLLARKPAEMEIILTGRYATPRLYEIADLITEMHEIRHYYQKGVEARKGIEF
jgi:cob(I)alamin adenosyltransferase